MKNTVSTMMAGVGTFISAIFGGWDAALQVLLAMMVADYVTGVLVALVWKRSTKTEGGGLSSQAGLKGIIKKCMILLMVYIAVMLDKATGMDYARMAVVFFFIGNEGISLMENIGLMGVSCPAFITELLAMLKKKGDNPTADAGGDLKSKVGEHDA